MSLVSHRVVFIENDAVLSCTTFGKCKGRMFSREIYEFFRSSHRRCYMKNPVLKNFAIFTGKLQACNFIKKRLQHRCFPGNIVKFLRTPILRNIFWFFKTATEQQLAAASILTLLLSSDNLLTLIWVCVCVCVCVCVWGG